MNSQRWLVRCLFLLSGMLMLPVAACTGSMTDVEPAFSADPLPIELIAEVDTPGEIASEWGQIAFCYFDTAADPMYQREHLKVLALATSSVHEITQQFWTSPFGLDLGCPFGFSWSPDGEKLLMAPSAADNFVQAGIGPDGSQLSEQVFLDYPQYASYGQTRHPEWSPDGQYVAFIGDEFDTFPSVYLARGNGTPVGQLSDSFTLPGVVSDPVWSHDGTKIAYVLPVPDNGIGIIDLASGTITEFSQDSLPQVPRGTDHPSGILPPESIVWLPGDELLLFLTNAKSAEEELLWMMTPDGSYLKSLLQAPVEQISLAPDGKRLAIVVSTEDGSRVDLLQLQQNPEMRTILDAGDWDSSHPLHFRDVEWSPDGTQLAFAANPYGNYDLFTWEVATGAIAQLTNTPGDETHPRWRPPRE